MMKGVHGVTIRSIIGGILCLAFAAGPVSAQETDITIGEIDIPQFRWGRQPATFTVTNNSDWFRYVTVVTEMSFEGTYLSPTRFVRLHYSLEPGQKKNVTTFIDIPGNFGKAKLRFAVYDVIDTLDVLMESQKIFEQPFFLHFKMSEEIFPYFDEMVTLPPMVMNNPMFDNEFSHILPFMLLDGKSVSEIAAMTESDSDFVNTVIESMIRNHFLERDSSGVKPTFPVVSLAEAKSVKKIAEEMSDSLAALIERNLPNYAAGLDSLIAAGTLSSDTNDFLGGGTVLHHRYPVIGGLFLWGDLGQKFIAAASRRTLMIYARTDPCKAYIPKHMYAVKGGPALNGHQYFNLLVTGTKLEIDFADEIPSVDCPENPFIRRILRERREWNYTKEDQAESFIFDQNIVNVLMKRLDDGSIPLLSHFSDMLKEIGDKYGRESDTDEAYRYWFWNLTVTRTTDKLIAAGQLVRRGNGHYKFYMKKN